MTSPKHVEGHTPTPWYALGAGVYAEDPNIFKPGTPLNLIAATGDEGPIPDAEQEKNAAFIALACTAHDGLVAALRNTERGLSYALTAMPSDDPLIRKVRVTLDAARAALKNATEPT